MMDAILIIYAVGSVGVVAAAIMAWMDGDHSGVSIVGTIGFAALWFPTLIALIVVLAWDVLVQRRRIRRIVAGAKQ